MSHHHITAENAGPFADRAIDWAKDPANRKGRSNTDVIFACAQCREQIEAVLRSGKGSTHFMSSQSEIEGLMRRFTSRAKLFDDGKKLSGTELDTRKLTDKASVRAAIENEIVTKERFVAAAEIVCREKLGGATLSDVLSDQARYAQEDPDAMLQIRANASTARNAMALELYLRAALLGEISVVGGGQGVKDDPVEMP
ncbi:hypothetical protein HZA43_01435 [Candidatus Peregrinibacteria bacterium]|nr:hypothetical protein [Candidatus Peregrinibacteria bacterium]